MSDDAHRLEWFRSIDYGVLLQQTEISIPETRYIPPTLNFAPDDQEE